MSKSYFESCDELSENLAEIERRITEAEAVIQMLRNDLKTEETSELSK